MFRLHMVTNDNEREAAQRARADAATADAAAARACVERLVVELLHARGHAAACRARLEAVRRRAVAAVAHCRDERAALALGDIAVRATLPESATVVPLRR